MQSTFALIQHLLMKALLLSNRNALVKYQAMDARHRGVALQWNQHTSPCRLVWRWVCTWTLIQLLTVHTPTLGVQL